MKNQTVKPTSVKTNESKSTKSNEKTGGEDSPAYPPYPASEDIMNPANDMEKTDLNEENFSPETVALNPETIKNNASAIQPATTNDEEGETEDNEVKSEADLTEADFLALGSDEINTSDEDDLLLQKRTAPVDMAGSDLDVPGSELDDDDEMVGSEDEENNTYSIGGDRHDDLEENSDDNEEQL
ncbi:MAG: hypothetical protein WBB36_10110 [Chitinophagales bacterium]